MKENIRDLKELESLDRYPILSFDRDGSVSIKNKNEIGKNLSKIEDKIKDLEKTQKQLIKTVENMKIILSKNEKFSKLLKLKLQSVDANKIRP
jgi:hypothetical protein